MNVDVTPAQIAPAVPDDDYDAALAVLLSAAACRPGPLTRLGRGLMAALRAIHHRRCAEADHLDPWLWYVSW